MIGMLRGTVAEVGEGSLVLMCGPVGYEVMVPTGLAAALPMPGDELTLHVNTLVRQDAIVLCGFSSSDEKRIFNKLLTIQGVGPRLAMAVLGTLGPDGLLQAAGAGDARRIQSVPGVGKKTAERVVLELRDKLPELSGSAGGLPGKSKSGAVLQQALSALGFKKAEVDMVLREIKPEEGESEQQLVTRALKFLNARKAAR